MSACLMDAGIVKDECDICVIQKKVAGTQCTIAMHVNDLIVTSVGAQVIEDVCSHVKERYGNIARHDGPVLNYLGIVFGLSKAGEVRITMKGYIEETLAVAGVAGNARSTVINGLFETRDSAELVPGMKRASFHSVVVKLCYLPKRAKFECHTATAFLATRVTRCTGDDVDTRAGVLKYITDTKEMGMISRPGKLGTCVRVFVDAAYGAHSDWKSHAGSCVFVGDVGAGQCKSSKQCIFTK